jgi:hypothetical protein
MEANLLNPNFISLMKKFEETKNEMRENYRPIKSIEIEKLFFKWAKIDYSRKKYVKITTLMEHIIQRESAINPDSVEYLKAQGNQKAFSIILAKLCVKYKANCRKFNDGKSRIDREGCKMKIYTKRYALTLI